MKAEAAADPMSQTDSQSATPTMAYTVLLTILVSCTLKVAHCLPEQRTGEQLECVCTSTHFPDVNFSVKCRRNSTGYWSQQNTQQKATFIQDSSVSCERGPPPPLRSDYHLVSKIGHFKFHPRQTTWDDALRSCAREGAALAIVTSEAETQALRKIFKEFPKLHEEDWLNDQVWVGATDLKTEGTFLSLRGKTLKEEGYEKWADGEPNNENNDEHCLAFDRNGLYNDEPCHINLAFICKKNL